MIDHPIPRRGPSARLVLLGLALCMGPAQLPAAEVTTGTDADSTLPYAEWAEQGVSVRLVQRLPDQTRAFFIGRGFDPAAADRLGNGCVFQTVFRNDGPEPVEYDLAEWRLIGPDGIGQPLKEKRQWEEEWRSLGVPESARIAFRWATLPERQRFEPGDFNWGMIALGLEPGQRFTLEPVLQIGDRRISGLIPNLECPREEHP